MSITTLTPEIIAAAIEGFESQKQRIDLQITELHAMLNGEHAKSAASPQKGKRRKMTAVGRKRIAEAQRKRWAVAKGLSEPARHESSKPKRRLSAAGKAAIVAALKKRWALKRAAATKVQEVPVRKAGPKKVAVKKAA